MPKGMIWIELLFNYFPINKNRFSQQMLARLILLLAIWLTGLLAYTLDGKRMTYLSEQDIYRVLFGTIFIILFGSFMVQRSLDGIIPNLYQILKLTEQQFQEFCERLKRYSFSFIPSLFITVALVYFDSRIPLQIEQLSTEGLKAHFIWNLIFTSFSHLLVGTAFWMFASIWLVILLVSRQPLNIKLSTKMNERFRDLSRLALFFSLFYFIAISLQILTTSQPLTSPLSILSILLSPNAIYIIIGVIGILFPFYMIHTALLQLKKTELNNIKEKMQNLSRQLDEILANQPTGQLNDQIIAKMALIFNLQVKEKQIMAAQEWPIDLSFLSRLTGLVLIPILARIFVEIINQTF